MQSQKRSTRKKEERPRLPWGLGSASKKGRVWWLVYRDAENELHYENSGTEDAAEARYILAERALPRAKASVEMLEKLINERPPKPPADQVIEEPAPEPQRRAKVAKTLRPRKGGVA